MSGRAPSAPVLPGRGAFAVALVLVLILGALAGPLRAGELKPDLYIQVEPGFVGFDLSKISVATVKCEVGAVAPGPAGYSRSNVLGAGSATVLAEDRGWRNNDPATRVTIYIDPKYDGAQRMTDRATSYFCRLVYSCRDTEQTPRPMEPGDPLLADPKTACLGFDAKRSPLSVSGTIPEGWD